jgi:foldase protein PrsA
MAKTSRKSKRTSGRKSSRRDEPEAQQRQTRKQVAFSRKEARQKRIILISVGIVALIVITILAVGLIQEFVVKPSEPVAIVNGTKVHTDDYQDLVASRSYNLLASMQQIDTTQEGSEFLISLYEQQLEFVPQAALEELIEDVLIGEEAEKLGLTVQDAEIDQALFGQSEVPETATGESPTPIPQEELDERYKSALQAMGLSDAGFRDIVRRGLLRSKLQDQLSSQVETTGLVAQVEIIQTVSEEEARDAYERVDTGEDFAIVAQEVSTDTSTAELGGELGSVTLGQISARYGEDLERAAFSMSAGDMRVVQSDGQWYVVRVLEIDENGALPEDFLAARQASALDNWLEEQKLSPDIEIERLLDPGALSNPILDPQLP